MGACQPAPQQNAKTGLTASVNTTAARVRIMVGLLVGWTDITQVENRMNSRSDKKRKAAMGKRLNDYLRETQSGVHQCVE
jgi:hypothetical protein